MEIRGPRRRLQEPSRADVPPSGVGDIWLVAVMLVWFAAVYSVVCRDSRVVGVWVVAVVAVVAVVVM